MIRKRNLAVTLATGLLVCVQAVLAQAQDSGQSQRYVMGSSVPGSVPYNIGIGLSSLAQIVLLPQENINLSSAATDGHHDSLRQIFDGTSQFGIVDSVSASQAAAGSDEFEGLAIGDQLTAVATLWHEVDHFIIANEYVQSGTISDLAILRSEDFQTNLGNLKASKNLLGRFGVLVDEDLSPASFDWEAQRDSFDQGEIAGLAITGPVPSEAVQDILRQLDGRAQLLEFSNWQMGQIGKGWHIHPITPNDYPGLATNVDTVGRTVMLVAHRDVPEEAVYQVLKMMFENLPYLENVEKAAAQISLDGALDEIQIPFHLGAVRYYEEIGVLAEGVVDLETGKIDAAFGRSVHAGHTGAGGGQVDAAVDQSAYANHAAHSGGKEGAPPEHVHDEAMLARARAEVHEGEVILKIGRPPVLRHPETAIFTIYFGLGKTEPAEQDIASIRQIHEHAMATLETYGREPEVYVEGHTDRSGSWETNYEIAHRRARSVVDLMIAEGMPESWLHISDYSEEGLAVPTADGVTEERNRRVEVTVIPQE